MRSGASARLEREKAAMAKVQNNQVVAKKAQMNIENVELAGQLAETETTIKNIEMEEGKYITGTQNTCAEATWSSAHTDTANAKDNQLATHVHRETVDARTKDAGSSKTKREQLEAQTHDLSATNAKIPIASTDETLVKGQAQQQKETQSMNTMQKLAKKTPIVEDEPSKNGVLVNSESLDVSWLVEQVKGLATEGTGEVDWLVQEIQQLAKKTAVAADGGETLINADVHDGKAACNNTEDDMVVLGGNTSMAEGLAEHSRVGIGAASVSKGDNTHEQLELSLKKSKSLSTPKDQSGALYTEICSLMTNTMLLCHKHPLARQRGRSKRKSKSKRKRKKTKHTSPVQPTATTPLSAPAKLLQQPVAVTSMQMSTLHSLATVGATPMQVNDRGSGPSAKARSQTNHESHL